MTLKKKKINGKHYYYIEKNLRIGKNEWKTFSIYIGIKKPSNAQLKKYERQLQKEIKKYVKNKILKPKDLDIV